MFSISQKSLATISRNLGTLLSSGVPVVKAFRLAGRKAADKRLRNAFSDAAEEIRSGQTVTEALENTHVFPQLYVDLTTTAEQTGALPEVLHALADHYDKMVELRRDFRAQITMPVFQLTAAVLIIALLIFLLGAIAGGGPKDQVFDPVGLGLSGVSGALTWLGGWAAGITVLVLGYKIMSRSVAATRVFDRFLLNIPVVGTCLTNFALARFSWAYHLTQNAGLSIDESIKSSMKATSNGAYIGASQSIVDDIYDGSPLSDALEHSSLFPPEFIEMVSVGESSGTVPEALHRLGPQLEDQARRSLRALAGVAGWLVWSAVAAFIIFVIFRFMFWYIALINDAGGF